MDVQRLAAFADGNQGGNPAGVVIGDTLPDAETMQRIATEVGYSETAFAAPDGDHWTVRYFAPVGEVPFCGHATVALGAALGRQFGAGSFALNTQAGPAAVRAEADGDDWQAELTSPPTWHDEPHAGMITRSMELFGLTGGDLAEGSRPVRAHAGADHLIFTLADRNCLADMSYNLEAGGALMREAGLVTISLIYVAQDGVVHSRNPFASGGVMEDPATGAAAAALVGWWRDAGIRTGRIEIAQGHDMGVPSRLFATALPQHGAGVRVAGRVRVI
ncbi:phenazine biosynthesis protein PhzF family [Monaibacterium marinum]|uniref:Phenazine biosynthesis protein PhzF family n=1 Tax=Pontivivens marinum TaxID=1690039 RepID=A0A2C9CRB7_9RHOB|nr:PhzF family phenazine biosynthesis protein [Monaibacterium marinum]SOH94091.1 phenazine biosynthesis protein PhzF family [Monaibacterium marinum]